VKHKRPIAILLFCAFALAPFSAAATEADAYESEYVRAFLNNQYLRENIRLIALAEERQRQGRYNDAVDYAREAIRFAQLSDDYIAMQLTIRDTHEAIAAAAARLEWARRSGAPTRYAGLYERAQSVFADALDAREREAWAAAMGFANQVVGILAGVSPVLPARFLVRTWEGTRDCLWNIAALPEIYGDGSRWQVLYQANSHRMPRPGNPHLIRPGMILDIPSIAGEVRYGIMEY